MRPIKLNMTAFGPYVGQVELDFERGLGDEKIFLIHGATGAGKTTILDAISYALYGKTSGNARDAKDMRSKGAADDVATEIEFKFALGEKIYTAQRTITYHPNRKDNKYQAKCALTCDGHVLETREGAFKNRINELLGFDVDQFRQVVLLPQGEFKKFLAADSDKRQEVLNVLFDTAPYKNIEDALAERAKNSSAQVDTLTNNLETLDRQIKDAGTDSPSAVEEKLSALQKNLTALKKLFDDAQIKLADGKSLAGKFDELQKATTELNDAQFQLAEAEKIFSAAQTEYQQRESQSSERKDLERRITDLQKLQETLAELQKKFSALETESNRLEQAKKNFATYDERATRYQKRLDELTAEKSKLDGADVKFEQLKQLWERAKQRDKLKAESSRLKNALELEQEKLSVVEKNFTAAQVELNRLQIVNSAAHLATKLKPGEPCPVCGSLEHPAIIAEAIPSAAEIQAAEKNLETLTKEKSQQERTVTRISTNISNLEEQLKNFDDVPDTPTVQKNHDDAEEKSKALKDCLKSIENGERFIKDNRNALDDATAEKNSATVAVEKIKSAISQVKSNVPEKYLDAEQLDADLTAAQKIFRELDGAWTAAQKNFTSADKNKSACVATFNSAKKIFGERQDAVKNQTPPDLPALEKNFDVANENYGAARDEKTRLEMTLKTIKDLSSKREELKQELDAKTKIADMWRRLSDVANATGRGESDMKISFQRYYLSTMFDEVVAEANNRLKKMSGGRYLFQMKDAGKTKAKSAGLNLEIFDEYTGALRPVETLSGGESFLASLSLALGLAAVVQNNSGGIKLDTIFIDEGFGSLDSETLDDAIKTIIEQSGGRLVGIISHVEELKNQMPVRLEVTKTKTGSTAKFIS